MASLRNWYRAVVCVSAFCAASLSACGGTQDGEQGTSGKPVIAGGACTEEGATAKADDGCNTCVCSGGAWGCTKIGCGGTGGSSSTGGKPAAGGSTSPGGKPAAGGSTSPGGKPGAGGEPSGCVPGPSDDGCNECTCVDGQRVCTDKACPPVPECKQGETRPAGDGCNTCSCQNGRWLCTLIGCSACIDGDTKKMDCNTCHCTGGQWACTRMACPTPDTDGGTARGCGGWLGDTCTDVEYCAYVPGQYCGMADASATCKARPAGCTKEYRPVCGCDGNTYSNACMAAAAGTGVMSEGSCGGR